MSAVIDIPVIVIGGGGCGLSFSCFLSDYGVEHVLFEKHHTTSILPKAHYLNQRTMEIFRQHGMSDELVAKCKFQSCLLLLRISPAFKVSLSFPTAIT